MSNSGHDNAVKGIVHPKIKFGYHLLKLFQTCIHFLVLLNTKEDVLKFVTKLL